MWRDGSCPWRRRALHIHMCTLHLRLTYVTQYLSALALKWDNWDEAYICLHPPVLFQLWPRLQASCYPVQERGEWGCTARGRVPQEQPPHQQGALQPPAMSSAAVGDWPMGRGEKMCPFLMQTQMFLLFLLPPDPGFRTNLPQYGN